MTVGFSATGISDSDFSDGSTFTTGADTHETSRQTDSSGALIAPMILFVFFILTSLFIKHEILSQN
jgi:hypothetical protein